MARRIAGTTVAVRIVGVDGPGRSCPGPDGIALGIQREKDVLDAVPSSSEEIRFDAGFEVVQGDDALDFRVPMSMARRASASCTLRGSRSATGRWWRGSSCG